MQTRWEIYHSLIIVYEKIRNEVQGTAKHWTFGIEKKTFLLHEEEVQRVAYTSNWNINGVTPFKPITGRVFNNKVIEKFKGPY